MPFKITRTNLCVYVAARFFLTTGDMHCFAWKPHIQSCNVTTFQTNIKSTSGRHLFLRTSCILLNKTREQFFWKRLLHPNDMELESTLPATSIRQNAMMTSIDFSRRNLTAAGLLRQFNCMASTGYQVQDQHHCEEMTVFQWCITFYLDLQT